MAKVNKVIEFKKNIELRITGDIEKYEWDYNSFDIFLYKDGKRVGEISEMLDFFGVLTNFIDKFDWDAFFADEDPEEMQDISSEEFPGLNIFGTILTSFLKPKKAI